MIHIWHEDSVNSATTQFWIFLKQCKVNEILKDADIQGFSSNQKLANYVAACKFNSADVYHIFVDRVADNQKALRYYSDIKNSTAKYTNVIVHDLLCFEYMILKFRYFVAWTKPIKHNRLYDLCEGIRSQFIQCIKNNISWTQNIDIVNFVVARFRIDTTKTNWRRELQFISSEDIATALLSDMTNGGTIDFGVSKTRLGACWQCNCCIKYSTSTIGNKKCRLYKYNKQSIDKARNLWNNTYAKNISKGA